jgi:hypothetical protein
MHDDVRSIYFSTVLQYPPFEGFRITRDQIQSLFQELRKNAGHRYENLHLQGKPSPYLSTEQEETDGFSKCEIGKQSIRVIENEPEITIGHFTERVCAILTALGDNCPPILMQRCEVRLLANTTHAKSALDLLTKHTANVFDKIAPFGRPPSHFGLRFRFHPYSLEDIAAETNEGDVDEDEGEPVESEEHDDSVAKFEIPDSEDSFITARLETYGEGRKQVWIEVVSSCPCRQSVNHENLDPVKLHIDATYRFATDKCLAFLNQWDKKSGEKEG